MYTKPNPTGFTELAFYIAVSVMLLFLAYGATGLDLGSSSAMPAGAEEMRETVHSLLEIPVSALMGQIHNLHTSFLNAAGV